MYLPSLWLDFPGGTSGKEPACQCRRHKRCRLDPWVRKIPWRRAWQPPPVFLPGESHGWGARRATVCGVTKSPTRLRWHTQACSWLGSQACTIPCFWKIRCKCYFEGLITICCFVYYVIFKCLIISVQIQNDIGDLDPDPDKCRPFPTDGDIELCLQPVSKSHGVVNSRWSNYVLHGTQSPDFQTKCSPTSYPWSPDS